MLYVLCCPHLFIRIYSFSVSANALVFQLYAFQACTLWSWRRREAPASICFWSSILELKDSGLEQQYHSIWCTLASQIASMLGRCHSQTQHRSLSLSHMMPPFVTWQVDHVTYVTSVTGSLSMSQIKCVNRIGNLSMSLQSVAVSHILYQHQTHSHTHSV